MQSPLRRFGATALLALTALACSDTSAPELAAVKSTAALSATRTEDVFFTTAMCMTDLGFNIRFGGPRTLVRHVNGGDTTLSFGTQAFQGWRLPETIFDASTVDYAVLGGAEMFNIKRADDGTLEVRIHEGTLVFRSLATGERIVVRHIIRFNPALGQMVSTWSCR